MTIKIDLTKRELIAGDLKCMAWCHVRNELNRQRLLIEKAVYTINQDGSKGVPYMPREFPRGTWNITGIHEKSELEPYLYPYFISTDATQLVNEWSINPDGTYCARKNVLVSDYDYGIHYSNSNTTLGCIRIGSKSDIEALVSIIRIEIANGRQVKVEVI